VADPVGPQLRTGALAYLEACALLLLIVGYLVEALRRTPSRARVADLLLAAREDGNRTQLAELVARALGDPEATVWWWDPAVGSYRDAQGLPQADAHGLPASRVLTVRSVDRPLALVIGSRALPTDPRVMEPVTEALRLATENRRLSEELAASLDEVRESRTRILTASDEARKRIERDLHDGAQQLLVATAATLNLAQSELDDSDAEVAKTLDQATDQLGRALTELRNLAAGITPTALVHGSLVDAVGDLALRCPVPALVRVAGDRNPDLETSLTAYFVVAECLSNVAKHAGASRVRIDLALEEPFRVTVSDDGQGGAEPAKGSGLRGMADRVEVRGGALSFQSSSTGTSVTAILPATPTPEVPA
jgi:signal transduction histidine kinase